MSAKRRKIETQAPPAPVSPGTMAVRNRLREMLADAVRSRASWVAVGSLALAFILTFVLAPLLSLVLAGLAGAGAQMLFSRISGKAPSSPGRAPLGAMPAVDLRAARRGGGLFHLFCALSSLVFLSLGPLLAWAAHDYPAALGALILFGALSAMLARR